MADRGARDEPARRGGAVVVDLQIGRRGGLALPGQRERDRRQCLVGQRGDGAAVHDRPASARESVTVVAQIGFDHELARIDIRDAGAEVADHPDLGLAGVLLSQRLNSIWDSGHCEQR